MIIDNLWAVLSTALLKGVSPKTREALNIITEDMIEDKFSLEVYKTIKQLDQFGSTVSLIAVDDVASGKLGYSDLIEATQKSGPTSDPIYSAMQVRAMHNDKLAANELKNILGMIQGGKPFEREAVSQSLSELSQLLAPEVKSKPKPFSEFVTGYIDVIEERQKNPQGSYLDIGLNVIVEKVALVVAGGQPGMGKTALALFCNRYVAQQGLKTLMFSLEMEGGQLFEREVAAFAKIPTRRLKKVGEEDLTDLQWAQLTKSLDDLDKQQIFIDDDPTLSMPILQKKCREFKEKHPDLALITVDYLTLMKMPDAYSRALSVGEATRQMKLLAKELKTPILLLSQLNREADKALREPRPSDLRDSGSIEQDADIIVFPYREEVHKPESNNKGLVKVIKAKVRDDEVGEHILSFENGAMYESSRDWSETVEEDVGGFIPRKKF